MNREGKKESKDKDYNLIEKFSALSNLLDSTNDLIMIIEPKSWKIIYINDNMAKSLNKNKHQLLSKDLRNFIPKNVADFRRKALEKVIETRKTLFVQDQNKGRWFFNSVYPIFDEKGDIAYIATITQEITDKKIIEDRYQTIFNNILDGILITDSEGIIKDCNPATLNILGYKNKDELIGTRVIDIYANPKQREQVLIDLNKKDYVSNYELTFKKADGQIINTLGSARFLKDLDGNFIGIFGTFRNITERINAENEIKNSRRFLQNVIDSASEIIILIDNDFKVTWWNKSAVKLTSFKKSEIIGKKLDNLKLFVNPKEIKENIKNYLKGHFISCEDIILNTKEGFKKIIRISCSPIKNKEGKIQGVIIIGKNITKEASIHGKLIPCNSYLIEDSKSDFAFNIFSDLISSNRKGLLITRSFNSNNIFEKMKNKNIKLVLLGENLGEEIENCCSHKDIIDIVNRFSERNPDSIILLDRIDYLLTLLSFNNLIKTIYKITSTIYNYKCILLIRLNPQVFNDEQINIIREEIPIIPSQKTENIHIDEHLYKILDFINQQTNLNILVSYSMVQNKFHMSKVTTAKRLKNLELQGLIYINIHGRLKRISLSNNGKKILQKRSVI